MTRNKKFLFAGASLAVLGLGGAAAIARHGEGGWSRQGFGHHDGQMHMGGFMGGGMGGRFCHGDGAEVADHMLVRIEHKVKPTDAQKASFEDLKSAARSAVTKMQTACPKDAAAAPAPDGTPPARPSPIERLDRAQAMAEATLDALKTVRPAAEKFYASLSDEQKATLNEPREGKNWGRDWFNRGGRGEPGGEHRGRQGGEHGRGPGGEDGGGPGGEPSAPPRD